MDNASSETYKKEAKQVIVIRHDLHMRMGKVAAQASHASIAFLTRKLISAGAAPASDERGKGLIYENVHLSSVQQIWIEGRFTKICVRVDSEEELRGIHKSAIEAGLVSYLIEDAGLTEFNGVPTVTACGIGPDYDDRINPITGHLKLL